MIDDLNGLQRDLLFIVCGLDEPNGQEIQSEIEDSQHRSVQSGQLYKNLDRLADRGLVSKGKRDGRTNQYELTEEGMAVVESLVGWQMSYLVEGDTGMLFG